MARPVLRTPLCDLLGIEYPIILAGMGAGNEGGAAGPELVAAVSEAGGLGVLGGTGRGVEEMHDAIAEIRKLTSRPFGVDVLLPMVGVTNEPQKQDDGKPRDPREYIDQKYWEWADEAIDELGLEKKPPPPSNRERQREVGTLFSSAEVQRKHVEAIIAERPNVLAAGLGSPKAYVQQLHANGIKIIGLVGNVKNAVRVKNDGVDVVVAQGHEAGGHTGRIGTFALVPQVVDAISPTPVVLAGGVRDGRGIAAAMALGAQGVWVGTAFLATPEANITKSHKDRLLAATEEDTRVTRLFSGKTARALRSPLIDSWETSGLAALPSGLQAMVASRVSAAARASNREDLQMQLAGQVAGALTQIRPARVVLEEMVREAIEVLGELGGQRVKIEV